MESGELREWSTDCGTECSRSPHGRRQTLVAFPTALKRSLAMRGWQARTTNPHGDCTRPNAYLTTTTQRLPPNRDTHLQIFVGVLTHRLEDFTACDGHDAGAWVQGRLRCLRGRAVEARVCACEYPEADSMYVNGHTHAVTRGYSTVFLSVRRSARLCLSCTHDQTRMRSYTPEHEHGSSQSHARTAGYPIMELQQTQRYATSGSNGPFG